MLERAHARLVELSQSFGEIELQPAMIFEEDTGNYLPVKEADAEVPVKRVCTTCGSDDVRRNADLIWSIIDQKWEIISEYDSFDCEVCGCGCQLEEVPLTEGEYVELNA